MDITPLDIKQKQFTRRLRGFDITEVDTFLDEVTEEMEGIVRECESLKEANGRLTAQVAEYKETEKNLRDTLMSAQRMSEEMKTQAERESQLRLKEAEAEAEHMLSDARKELARAEEEINELKRIKERFALKLRGMIEDHLKMLSYEEKMEGPGQ